MEKDQTKAALLYHKAAVQGHDLAQAYLGICHEHGKGVETNLVEAFAYYSLDKRNLESAKRLEGKLSSEQITAGKMRASELRDEIAAKKAGK